MRAFKQSGFECQQQHFIGIDMSEQQGAALLRQSALICAANES